MFIEVLVATYWILWCSAVAKNVSLYHHESLKCYILTDMIGSQFMQDLWKALFCWNLRREQNLSIYMMCLCMYDVWLYVMSFSDHSIFHVLVQVSAYVQICAIWNMKVSVFYQKKEGWNETKVWEGERKGRNGVKEKIQNKWFLIDFQCAFLPVFILFSIYTKIVHVTISLGEGRILWSSTWIFYRIGFGIAGSS